VIERVLAPNPGPMTGSGTNTYLVTDADGQVAVIDPGPNEASHLDAIQAAAARLGRITTVLVTHRHHDHLPAALPLSARTGAVLAGHPQLPGVQWPLADGQRCFGSLVALHTPGHTRESVCFWDGAEGALFTGDLVAGAGTVIVDDEPGGLSQYVRSLQRLLELGPRSIYPGHGPRVDDAPGKLNEYLAHRRQREQQILQVLAARRESTVDGLVGAIYTETPPGLLPMAARNVRATLDKLEAEGRVRRAGDDQWQATT
jgi:glyoxylase-like metal-dependent hydrolase (beta-lactamase superfamily II)